MDVKYISYIDLLPANRERKAHGFERNLFRCTDRKDVSCSWAAIFRTDKRGGPPASPFDRESDGVCAPGPDTPAPLEHILIAHTLSHNNDLISPHRLIFYNLINLNVIN